MKCASQQSKEVPWCRWQYGCSTETVEVAERNQKTILDEAAHINLGKTRRKRIVQEFEQNTLSRVIIGRFRIRKQDLSKVELGPTVENFDAITRNDGDVQLRKTQNTRKLYRKTTSSPFV